MAIWLWQRWGKKLTAKVTVYNEIKRSANVLYPANHPTERHSDTTEILVRCCSPQAAGGGAETGPWTYHGNIDPTKIHSSATSETGDTNRFPLFDKLTGRIDPECKPKLCVRKRIVTACGVSEDPTELASQLTRHVCHIGYRSKDNLSNCKL